MGKRAFKNISIILLVLFCVSCSANSKSQIANINKTSSIDGTQELGSITVESPLQLASDKLQSYDEIDKKYKSLKLKYSKNREDYLSDEVFANFRNVKVGNIKEGILYRGASPIDNSMGRAKYANKLIEKANIKYDIDLTDDEKKKKKHFSKKDFASEYFKKLYENGQAICLNIQIIESKNTTTEL